MNRSDIEAVLASLKPFQRRTVDHAFDRLFLAKDSTSRFLVADEVGLGKTLVARGLIARTIEHLWDTAKRIDIVYICSNGSIARANLPKLHVGATSNRSFALVTRLTMLATELAPRAGRLGLAASKVNFVSFTPGTSFDMGKATGQSEERVVLFRLLEPVVKARTGLMNLLQAGISNRDNWRWRLKNSDIALDPSIATNFRTALNADTALLTSINDLIEQWYHYHRDRWPLEARQPRNYVISQLRQMLAKVCVLALEPDLVILDEFQRFKNLLETREDVRDEAAILAQTLFGAQTPEGQPVRTLLLSATPYKLYTADAEIQDEDHYEDFLATSRFLMGNDEERVTDLQRCLSEFGLALKQAASGNTVAVVPAKKAVENVLRSIMARTERISASEDRDAMVEEPCVKITVKGADVKQYMAADALFKAVGDRDPMVFWKSAPYLMHFMRGYTVHTRIQETLEQSPERLAKVLREHAAAFLEADKVTAWQAIDPANGKLREMVEDLLDGGLWRLLWMPPTFPYWPLAGPFAGQEGKTKALVFSSWNVVPDVVSAILSYEAERRMVGSHLASYSDPAEQQGPLLRLTASASGARSRHRLLLLLLPCLSLADQAHPLTAPAGINRRDWVRSRVESMLAIQPNATTGDVDERWEWAAPMLLDPGLRSFIEELRAENSPDRPNPEQFPSYLDDLLHLDLTTLGRRPEGLVDLLADLALASPAVVVARTLAGAGVDDDVRRRLSLRLGESFWRMFNRPAVISLLLQLAQDAPDPTHNEGVYWRLVLRYCRDGNLQAVVDEVWHLEREQHTWAVDQTAETTAEKVIAQLIKVVEPTPSRVHTSFWSVDADTGNILSTEIRVRTDFALRFGDVRTEEGKVTQDTVRAEFNSPFRPFVLASTSVGQEGLDFHPWCHRLVHWNLPGNPVDLEQREGRVHRYKGHAVRKNVALSHATEALAVWKPGEDLWQIAFQFANDKARATGESDLVPNWIAPGSVRVQRHVPMLPYTQEVEAFKRLKRQLAAYRVVFGQPRQEELITLLDQAQLDVTQLREWAVDLSP